jgi:hypothetical protein
MALAGNSVVMLGRAAQDEQVREHVDDIDRLSRQKSRMARHSLVNSGDHVKHADLASIMGAAFDKVVRRRAATRRLNRSSGSHPPWSGVATAKRQPAAAW